MRRWKQAKSQKPMTVLRRAQSPNEHVKDFCLLKTENDRTQKKQKVSAFREEKAFLLVSDCRLHPFGIVIVAAESSWTWN